MIGALAVQLATLAIMGAGLCLMFKPLRNLAWKLGAVGILLVTAATVIPSHFG